MDGQAAAALQDTPEATSTLVAPASQGRARAALKRFHETIQTLLDAPLDESRVLEWTTLRAITSA